MMSLLAEKVAIALSTNHALPPVISAAMSLPNALQSAIQYQSCRVRIAHVLTCTAGAEPLAAGTALTQMGALAAADEAGEEDGGADDAGAVASRSSATGHLASETEGRGPSAPVRFFQSGKGRVIGLTGDVHLLVGLKRTNRGPRVIGQPPVERASVEAEVGQSHLDAG